MAPPKSSSAPGALKKSAGAAPPVYQPAPSREVLQARMSFPSKGPTSVSPGFRNHPPKQISPPPVYNPFPAAKPVQRHVFRTNSVINPKSIPMTGGVIQRVRVAVGFDRMSSGAAADVLVTSGLGNCIAVVAQDQTTNTAVMAHYDTNNGYTVQALEAVRVRVVGQLRTVVGAAVVPRYFVGLGSVWFGHKYNDNPNSADSRMWDMRHALIMAIVEVFGVEPTQAGYTIEFNAATGVMSGTSTMDVNIAIPQNWGSVGTLI